MIPFAAGSTSKSVTVQIVDDSGLGVTGLVAATFPTVYWTDPTGASTSITLSDLAALTSSYSSGGVKERSGGYYRLDLPNTVLASAGEKTLIGEASGKHLICPKIVVDAPVGAAASVTGNVGGNVVGSVASVTAGVNVTQVGGTNQTPGDLAALLTSIGVDVDALPSAATIAAAVLAAGDVDGYTLEQTLKLVLAAVAGRLSGGGTATNTIRAADNSKDRITATVDSDGNRTSVTLDAAG